MDKSIFSQTAREIARKIPSQRLTIAVSGGSDSVALLRLLESLRNSQQLQLTVFHVNHSCRKENDAEENWVRMLCERLSLPIQVVKLSKPSRTEITKQGFEAWARNQRLQAFVQTARLDETPVICLGHTSDDQAETFLIKLLRGSSLQGLGGMKSLKRMKTPPPGLIFWRPLLRYDRQFLRKALIEIGQDWLEDPTNSQCNFLRNRIRHELIPLMETIRPKVKTKICTSADDLRKAHSLIRKSTNKILAQTTPILFPIHGKLPNFLLAEALREWLVLNFHFSSEKISRPLVLRLVNLATKSICGRKLILDNYAIIRTGKGLEILKTADLKTASYGEVMLGRDNCVEFQGFSYHLSQHHVDQRNDGIWISDELAKNKLTIRQRKPGDFFHPAGSKGGKKLSRWLIDKKIPVFKRDKLVVIATGKEIIWIPTLAKSAAAGENPRDNHWFLERKKLSPPTGSCNDENIFPLQ